MNRGITAMKGEDARTFAKRSARSGKWPYEAFTQSLTKVVTSMMTSRQREDLEQWYTMCVVSSLMSSLSYFWRARASEVFGAGFDHWDPLEDDEELPDISNRSGVIQRMMEKQKQVLLEEARERSEPPA